MRENDFKAPEPTAVVVECITLACDYLKAAGELQDHYHQALLAQAQRRFVFMLLCFQTHGCRSEFLPMVKEFPVAPLMKDLRVASLFLQTVHVLYLGAACPMPPCWEIFHGPLFHYLCQNPKVMQTKSPTNIPASFDWTPIAKQRLLVDQTERV